MSKIVIFDLDDTLSESKTDLSPEMADLLFALLQNGMVGIISGCAHSQFEKQVLNELSRAVFSKPTVMGNLYLMPSSGSQLYEYDYLTSNWKKIYYDNLLLREKVTICDVFNTACATTGHHPVPKPEYGEIAEDRDSQITFSMFGQAAPLAVKKPYDPDQSKRLAIAGVMNDIFEELNTGLIATVGGSSSIDVTRQGSDKAAGVTKLLAYLNIDKDDVTFIADALFPGGNDHSVIRTGVRCIPTKNPEETKEIIKKLLEELNATV